MASRCKQICEAIALLMLILDVGVGWFNAREMYLEITEPEDTTPGKGNDNVDKTNNGNAKKDSEPSKGQAKKLTDIDTCPNPFNYWIAIVTFESVGTLLAIVQGYFICREIIQDKRLQKEGFKGAFVLVVLIYLLAVFPATLTEIMYRDSCVCKGLFLIDDTKHWRRDLQHLRRDIRDMAKSFLDGVVVMVLQLIIHAPQIYDTSRKACDMCCNIVECCRFAGDDARANRDSIDEIKIKIRRENSSNVVHVADEKCTADNTTSIEEPTKLVPFDTCSPDTNVEITATEKESVTSEKGQADGIDVNAGKGHCFIISFMLAIVFVVLFLTEVYYIFCNEEDK